MGFNIYEDTQSPESPSNLRRRSSTSDLAKGTDKMIAHEIFYAHASGDDVLQAGTAFKKACESIARAYPQLDALKIPQMEGRAFTLFDENYDGVIDCGEFLAGVEQLLRPTTPQAIALAQRLADSGDVTKTPKAKLPYADVKTVCIVGAGVAGLQTAKLLKDAGYTCTVFEKSSDVGGVWRENYADFGLQVPKDLYEFPGFPYPSDTDWELFPPGPQVQEYIRRYAKEFNLNEVCKFETAVLSMQQAGSGAKGWQVKYQRKGAKSATERFDFAVVATGMYGWPPHIPKARGHEAFKGEILHSCTFTDRKMAKGKRVVVVGGGKSAIDNAVAAAKEGVSSVLVSREMHWPVPRYLLNLVPFKWGTYSRFGHFMLETYHEESAPSWWVHSTCAPVKWMWWRVVETMFRGQFRISQEHLPPSRIENDVFNGGQILNYEARDMIKSGKIKVVVGSIDKFTEDGKGVVLTDGTQLDCEMVIYGTGFKKSYDMFDSTFVQPKLGIHKDGLYLYRNIIPPEVPDLAFIGCEVSTFNNILTHGLQALWLQKLLQGDIKLPSTGNMMKSIELEQAWKRSWMPPSSARASIWQLHMVKYHDNLVKDMGENHKRKGWNILGECFAPYSAADYKDLFKFK
eukprot:TRINITY_DN18437_c0_g1_i1.p1 TRINITY_DN18437_c0_g1~~TRINITY_DN18437_c0_g1_i1.p1  ORF type:complete len:628 (+),score=139.60 TRINITY_DN18437_c0_g1_i1:87-1970(+)